MLTIRFAALDDVPLLKTMIYEFAEFEHLPASITEKTLVRDGFGLQPKFRVLLAEWSGQAAGYAFFFDSYSSFEGRMIFLEDIFVRTQFRGEDIGRALFVRLAAIALENDCHGVMFNVLDWNKSAINFYRKLGAEFWNEWKTICLRGSALHAMARGAQRVEVSAASCSCEPIGVGKSAGREDLRNRVCRLWDPCRYSESGFAPGTRRFRNLIWPSWLDSCSAT